MYSLGYEGFIIKRIDNKIIVLGGSEEAQKDAFKTFVEDYIGYKKGKTPKSLSVSADDDIDEAQKNYRITSIKINGNDIKGYNIAVTDDIDVYEAAAESLQYTLYTKAGYWLPIVDIEEAGEKSIVIASVEDAGKDGFRIEVRENNLVIECAYNNGTLSI